MTSKPEIAAALADASARTEALLAPVDDARLMEQHDPLMSPLAWDYGHIGVFEDLWLVKGLSGKAPRDERWMGLYDASANPRRIRGRLPLMNRHDASHYRNQVRNRALEILERADLASQDPLLRDGYVYDLVIQHEHQHGETILQTLQLMRGGYRPALPVAPVGRSVRLDEVAVPAGRYPVGSQGHTPYDNERSCHWVQLQAYEIDRFPVTCGQYAEFVEDGGYEQRQWWSDAGWAWIQQSGWTAPKHWEKVDGCWTTQRFGHTVQVEMDRPVLHVCCYEAEACARRAGKRLPTEFEWEVAASWDPRTGRARRYPWGDEPPSLERANLGQGLFGCAPVGAYPDGASALGCEQMVGDAWEWTSSDFQPYPDFRAFPYPEYSEVFFGNEYKVLRGASWAARPSVARVTFRNWDYPIRRQIFAGFRCARDG